MDIKIVKNDKLVEKVEDSKLGFGKHFTPHMFIMDYEKGKGWHDARIVPFGSLDLHPAETVLHYGSSIFEGMKAYKTEDGQIQLFRPRDNMERLNKSAERLALPTIDEDDLMEALTTYIDMERDYVPSGEGTSLYIRPFMFGRSEFLGVHVVDKATYIIIASPSGAYYGDDGLKPVGIWIEESDVRAVRGGTGQAKCGGNYAAQMRASDEAEKAGYTQVLWLDGVERKYVEEVGAMNVMFKIGDKIVTPDLGESVLDGITRRSCIEILRKKGYQVEERKLSVEELVDHLRDGSLEEAWGTGTAAVISPIGEFAYRGEVFEVGDGKTGKLTKELYNELTGIQWGKIADDYGWTYKVEKKT